jgi:hypothetical protein
LLPGLWRRDLWGWDSLLILVLILLVMLVALLLLRAVLVRWLIWYDGEGDVVRCFLLLAKSVLLTVPAFLLCILVPLVPGLLGFPGSIALRGRRVRHAVCCSMWLISPPIAEDVWLMWPRVVIGQVGPCMLLLFLPLPDHYLSCAHSSLIGGIRL